MVNAKNKYFLQGFTNETKIFWLVLLYCCFFWIEKYEIFR